MANKIGTLYYDIDGNDKLKKILAEDKSMALKLQEVLKDTNAQMGKIDLRQLKQYNSVLARQQKDAILLEAAKKKSDDASILRQQKLQTEIARTEAAQKRAALVGTQGQQSLNRSVGISNKTMFSQNNLLNQLSQAAGIYFSIYQAGAFIKSLYTVSGEFEKQKISLAAILRDSSQAGILFERIKDLAIKSPFQFGELVSYTKQLSAFSVPYNELYDTTKRLADLSAGLGVDMSRLVLAFGQVRSASVLRGQELRQFTEAGIPLIDELAKKFTKLTGEATSAGDVFDKISRREVSFKMVKDIFTDLTSEGGKFYMMQEKQAESLAGKISNMKDSYQLMLNSIGEGNSGIMKDSIELLTSMMSNWESIAKVLKVLVATYGTYRAVLITVNTLQKASLAIEGAKQVVAMANLVRVTSGLTAATYRQVVAQGALNAVMSINPIYAAAVAISALVGALVLFHKETKTTAELQTELYNKIAQQQQATENLNESVKSYLSTATDLKKSDVDRQKALDNLQKLMPSVFKNLSLEKLAVLGVTDAYKLYSKEVNNTARIGAKTNYIMSLQRLIRLENELNAKIEKGEGGTLVLQDKIAQERAMLAIYKEQFSEQTRLANAQSEFNKKQSKWREEVDLMSKGATADIGYREDESYSDYISRIQDELEKATSANKKYKKENPFAKDEIDANNKQIQAYTKVLNKLGGTIKETSSGRAPSTSESDRRQKIKSNEDAITKIIADAEIERTRLKIQYAKDGYEKEQEQIQLNYDDAYAKAIENYKKVLTIAQETEKARWLLTAKKGEKFKSKITGYSDLTSTQKTAVDVGFSLAEEARISNINKLREQMVASSRDFNTKMQLIDKEYTDKVLVLSQTRTDANSEETDRAIAELNTLRNESISKLQFEAFKETPEWQKTFSDLDKLSGETLNGIISHLEKYKETAGKTLSVEDYKTLINTLDKLRDESINKNPFKSLTNALSDLQKALRDTKTYQEEVNRIQNGLTVGTTHYDQATGKIIGKVKTLTEAEDDLSQSQDDQVSASKRVKESWDKIGDLEKSLSDLGATLGGGAEDAILLADNVYNFISVTSDGITKLALSGEAALSPLEKASVILAIISAVIQVMKELNSILPTAYGEYEKYADKISEINKLTDAVNDYRLAVLEANNAENNWFSEDSLRNLQDYKELQEATWDSYLDKVSEAQAIYQNQSGGGWITNPWNSLLGVYDSIYGTSVFGRDYEKGTTAAINNLRIETRKKSKGFLGSGVGGHSQKTEDLQTWINANKDLFAGLDTDLFDENLKLNTELSKSILENYGDKLVGQTKETLESLVELQEQYDEYLEQLQEYVSSLYEPLATSMVDSLWDWYDEGKDALDSFEEYASDTFRDIASDMLRTLIMKNVFGTYQDDIAKLYEDYSISEGTASDLTKLNEGVTKYTQELMDRYAEQLPVLQSMITQIGASMEGIGINLKDTESSKSGIVANAQSLTEETGNILASYINAMRSDLSVIRSILDGSNSKGIYGQVYAIMQAYYPTIVNTLALQQAELVKIQSNTLRSANNSDGILTAIEELRSRFKQVTTSGSSVKMNV